MADLRPCPFCGGEARVRVSDSISIMRIECTECHMATTTFIADSIGESEAAETWNTRHVETCQITNKGEPEYNVVTRDYEFSCGHTIAWGHTYEPNYCPNCGRKVENG